MKKITSCALLIMFIFALATCGEAASVYEPEIHIPASPADTYEETPYDDGLEYSIDYLNDDGASYLLYCTLPRGFALVYNGVTIQMDQDMGYLLPLLGEPLGMFEAPSCAFDGIDRVFGFPGIQIHTYPDGDFDRVHTISFLNDGITTMSGITLGNSWGDVLAAYGNDY